MFSTTLAFVVILAYASAQVWRLPSNTERYPDNFKYNWQTNAGKGYIFGKLGSTDGSLFGQGGYKQDIFKDQRGHLEGTAYGSRVLGANGDSSSLGAKLGWTSPNDNAKLSADLNKQIGGRTGLTVSGDGVWKVEKNTRLEAGGNMQQTLGHGRPEVGLEAKIVHDF